VVEGQSVNSLRVNINTQFYYYKCTSNNWLIPSTSTSNGESRCDYLACIESEKIGIEEAGAVFRIYECGEHTCSSKPNEVG